MSRSAAKSFLYKIVKAMPPQAIDLFIAALAIPSSIILRGVRQFGIHKLPMSKRVLDKVGVFPIVDNYYDPQFVWTKYDDRTPRRLPGIEFNVENQLKLLSEMTYADELKSLKSKPKSELEFDISNGSYASGDAEYWYQIIRHLKPARIIEVGSGNSTLMAIKAIQKNKSENSNYECTHICIEPYEADWLEKTNVNVI